MLRHRCSGCFCRSPSSRRAWIEICRLPSQTFRILVALLAEGVDRNSPRLFRSLAMSTSPSSRRAWIEISCNLLSVRNEVVALLAEGVDRNVPAMTFARLACVALLAEGVDRNKADIWAAYAVGRRPPRGGRG